ncbi:MAG: hypothetical protein KDB35_15000 [Acidimicrobiales bacterium]|nr:hypothetical protein [Acidimicrobiales bacterium]MCB1015630.1 hypothetical protein [Acidimicrobiales bacterium]MCB9371943.1 hypothetical protein [Microthrixaceae bacterium]
MPETREFTSIDEALALIDQGLGDMLHRELVSTSEVADLLLDVRTLLRSPAPEITDEALSPN